MFVATSGNKLLLPPNKTLYTNSLNKESISLKFLFTNYFRKESNCTSDTYRTFEKQSSRGPATLLKKRLWQRCFPVNFVKFLRTPFYTKHLWWLLLEYVKLEACVYYQIRASRDF